MSSLLATHDQPNLFPCSSTPHLSSTFPNTHPNCYPYTPLAHSYSYFLPIFMSPQSSHSASFHFLPFYHPLFARDGARPLPSPSVSIFFYLHLTYMQLASYILLSLNPDAQDAPFQLFLLLSSNSSHLNTFCPWR